MKLFSFLHKIFFRIWMLTAFSICFMIRVNLNSYFLNDRPTSNEMFPFLTTIKLLIKWPCIEKFSKPYIINIPICIIIKEKFALAYNPLEIINTIFNDHFHSIKLTRTIPIICVNLLFFSLLFSASLITNSEYSLFYVVIFHLL